MEKPQLLRIAVIGDPHFMTSNVPEMTRLVQVLEDWFVAEKPDVIICLGDILHQHERIHITPYLLSLDFLRIMTKYAPSYLIIGNHDRPNNSNYLTTEHPFVACKDWENLTIIDTGGVVKHNGFTLAMIPYVPPGRFYEAYQSITKDECIDIVFAHQEFKGSKMGAITSTKGDVWSDQLPFCVSGHIHLRQDLGNVYYVGTPIQHDHGETQNKGVHMIEIGGQHTEPEIELKFKDLPLPKKITISLTVTQFDTFKLPEGSIKLIITGTRPSIGVLKKSKKYKEMKKKCKIHFVEESESRIVEKVQHTNYLDNVYAQLKTEKEREYLRNLLEE